MNGPAILDMWWRDVATVHWRADARVLEPLLPRGIMLDRFAGEAWLSVVPFRMTDVRIRFTPVLPGFGNVPELNLRTYVRVGNRLGIYFFSLDADAPSVVRAARLGTGLPYLHARIATSESNDAFTFASTRVHRGVPAGAFRARYRPFGDAWTPEPETLAHFLHERYLFFVRRGPALVAGEVRHAPWTLRHAEIDVEENTLGELAASDLSHHPAAAFFTRALHVRASAVLPLR